MGEVLPLCPRTLSLLVARQACGAAAQRRLNVDTREELPNCR